MDIKQQVVSLELAKQLKKAGYKQKGVWWWLIGENAEGHSAIQLVRNKEQRNGVFPEEICVVPTVAELGEALPTSINQDKKIFRLTIIKYIPSMQWVVEYKELGQSISLFDKENNKYVLEDADTEADARAKMWLYLKKNGLL